MNFPMSNMTTRHFIRVDLENKLHQHHLIKLLNDYMLDPMGEAPPMTDSLAHRIITGLKSHPGYLGFFAMTGNHFSALANCNINFSTFKGQKLLNIHDFIVAPEYRNAGIGRYLLNQLIDYSQKEGFCRINLEVRTDNHIAQNLYQSLGFTECSPKMLFWERNL